MTENSIRVKIPKSRALSLSEMIFQNLGWTIVDIDHHEFEIIGETNPTLRSWGEEIRVSIAEQNGDVIINIKSKPKAQLIDWGKSSENVEKFVKNLIKLINAD